MSAGNPDYQCRGNRPASLASCSKPTPSSQLTSLTSSITFLLCGSMLQQPEHVLGFLISLPLLKMSLPLPHSVPSLPGKILYLCASCYLPPSAWSLLLQRPSEVVSCFWPPGCQQHFYFILRESELVLVFPLCLRALESQKIMTCPTCFLAYSRSEELFVKSNTHLHTAVYFAILLWTFTACATSFTHRCLCIYCSLLLKYSSLLFSLARLSFKSD